jgi:hypothetical protein
VHDDLQHVCVRAQAAPESARPDPGVAAARAQINEATFAAAWTVRRAMTLDQAITEALDAINDHSINGTMEDENAVVR